MITITISQSNFEELAKLVVVPHEHCDGMNECHICDRPITEAAIEKIKELEAKCAEMRVQLAIVWDACCEIGGRGLDTIDADAILHALSSDCGKETP